MQSASLPPVLAVLAACALLGCENADSEPGVSWNGAAKPAAAAAKTTTAATKTAAATTTAAKTTASTAAAAQTASSNVANLARTVSNSAQTSSVGDSVSFSSLRWSFGGVNGSGARHDGVTISSLSCSKNGLSFRYVKNLSAWGLSNNAAGALACLFVQRSDGAWVGGKFDWISSSRTTRGFENIRSGYGGWSLSGVPNPCNVAFVIISADGRRRSNVITGRWTR